MDNFSGRRTAPSRPSYNEGAGEQQHSRSRNSDRVGSRRAVERVERVYHDSPVGPATSVYPRVFDNNCHQQQSSQSQSQSQHRERREARDGAEAAKLSLFGIGHNRRGSIDQQRQNRNSRMEAESAKLAELVIPSSGGTRRSNNNNQSHSNHPGRQQYHDDGKNEGTESTLQDATDSSFGYAENDYIHEIPPSAHPMMNSSSAYGDRDRLSQSHPMMNSSSAYGGRDRLSHHPPRRVVSPPPAAPVMRKPAPAPVNMIEVSPGLKLRLRGAAETREAIKNDFFSPQLCVACETQIFCISDAAQVICPTCRSIQPLWGSGVHDEEGGVGLGFTVDDLESMQWDCLNEQKQERGQSQQQASR
eukprot:CAMPEP_0198140312 /NCGR_PEP_ID=MMETSP1443-20131203/3487_1 /TAXON_ID=186043 /ORGANISM="Entomoneis sp., Strain CCMP2396" /LENGTH=359 /DNA_ID=CAMNT_0043802689 /DNA_START=18 /DNA_END=1097 /DNA_ORIENTATION=-